MYKYALITPARNEEDYIGKTLETVIAQTVQPVRWIIIDDGSTDRTAEIVREFAKQVDFIQLISVAGDKVRNFGSKSKAVAHAYSQMSDLDFDYVGNLDADIALYPEYYADILGEMEADPKLGVAGGIRYDNVKGEFVLVDCARNSVGGPIQMFRRDCWEKVGGYQALPYGGVDAVAETSARMYGWEVRSFPQYRVYHYRQTGTANRSIWSALYRAGIKDYTIGYHPLFMLARAVPRLREKPFVLGSFVFLSGYFNAMIRREKRAVSEEFKTYLQQEQLGRLRQSVLKTSGA